VVSISGQNFKNDISEVNNTLKNSENLSTVISTKVYGQNGKIKAQKKLFLKKKGNKFLYELDDFSILINTKHIIYVDKQDKSISYASNTNKQDQLDNISPELADLMDDVKKIEYKGVENGIKIYKLSLNDDLYEKAEIYINMSISMYTKIIFYYKSNEQHSLHSAVIEFQNTDKNTVQPDEIFSENKYIRIAQGRIYPSSSYNSYSVVTGD
jgi:hypothetical protein